MTREVGMATKADLKRLKHKEDCKELRKGQKCAQCKKYGYNYWQCKECKVSGYQGKVESHVCPGGCKKCYGKGYFTEITGGRTQHADFENDKTVKTGPILVLRFCICKAGKLAQRRKKSIMVLETKVYKLPTDFQRITNIKVNGKHYGRYKGNPAKSGRKHSSDRGKKRARANAN